MSTVTGVRVISAIALFVLTIIAGAVPPLVFTLWRRRKRNNVLSITKHDPRDKKNKMFNYHNIMQILMFFGGGILLATCFCHLIPEVRENLDNYFQHQKALTNNHHLHVTHDHHHDDHDHHDHEEVSVTQPPTVPLALTRDQNPNNKNSTNSNAKKNNSSTITPSATSNVNVTRKAHHHHHDDHDDVESSTSSTPHRHLHHSSSGHEEHLDHDDAATDKEEDDHDHDDNHAKHRHARETPRFAALHGHLDDDLHSSASDGHSHGSSNNHEESSHNHSHGIPYVELAVCGGFFVIYLLEELVHTFIGHQHEKTEEKEDQGVRRPSESTSLDLRSVEEGIDELETSSSSSGEHSPRSYSPSKNTTVLSVTSSVDDLTPTAVNPVVQSTHSMGNLAENKRMAFTNFAIDLKNEGNILSHPSAPSMSPPDTPESMASSTHAIIFATRSCATLVPEEYKSSGQTSTNSSKSKAGNHLQPKSVRFLQGLVVIIAFSAHSVFDGVAIGLQEESSRIWTMFFAICSHKLVVALAVGMLLSFCI